MLEYLPWSKDVLDDCITGSKQGLMPALDLELTAKCTGANCIYCDSKPGVGAHAAPNELDYSTLKKAIFDAKSEGLRWVFTCGLGEPLEDPKFWNLIALLQENDIRLSMFSNGLFIQTLERARKLKEHGVCIILKMDTFDADKFDIILGKPGTAKRIYRARDLLLEAGYGPDGLGHTDLAFSIVPTSLSIDGIPEVISFCKEKGIFASIGELEQAGEVINHNLGDTLGISSEQVQKLKQLADEYIGGCYMRPICPCIMTGVHIDNLGNCVVDRDTGLNCKWFMLKDPKVRIVGNLYDDDICGLHRIVLAYRKNAFIANKEIIDKSCDISYVFGGCGGNPRNIIALAKQALNK